VALEVGPNGHVRPGGNGHPALVPELALADENGGGGQITDPEVAELAGAKTGGAEKAGDGPVTEARGCSGIGREGQGHHLGFGIEGRESFGFHGYLALARKTCSDRSHAAI